MRAFVILAAALLLSGTAAAQDLLVKRNGEQMRVKILKITKNKVQFVRHGTELPVYSLPVSDIDYIEYPMGDRDTFGKSKEQPKENSQTLPPKWHGPVPKPVVEVSKIEIEESIISSDVYGIGDIYDKDGVKGVVISLKDGGRHGLIMSLDEACLAWSTLPRKKVAKVGAEDEFDGEANMRAIEQYIKANGLSWSDFPAFEWCRAKGEGWYLPSINELWSAGTMYLGGSRTASKPKFRKKFNENVESAGGKPISNIMIYHSSTEDKDPKHSKFSHMNSEQPYVDSGYKADDLFVRAFHKF